MSIIDAFKNSVLEGFNTTISGTDIVFSMSAALLCSLFILFIYQRTMKQTTLNRSFCISMLLVCSISAMMVLTITSNLALSLGMVGALSIVRFRTAVKDASDTAFLFWAVAAGITSGAGFYLLTLLGCLFVGVVCILSVVLFDRVSKPYLLVVRLEAGKDPNVVEAVLKQLNLKHALSSQIQLESHTEVICEIGLGEKQRKQLSKVKEIPGIMSVSLVDSRKG